MKVLQKILILFLLTLFTLQPLSFIKADLVNNISTVDNTEKYQYEKNKKIKNTDFKTSDMDFGLGDLMGLGIGMFICMSASSIEDVIDDTMHNISSALDINFLTDEDAMSVPTNPKKLKKINKGSLSKECTLDYAANWFKKKLIKQIIHDTTEWVKTGFNGEPAFMTKPDQFLYGAMDEYVGKILEKDDWANGVCSGNAEALKFAVNMHFNSLKQKMKDNEISIPKCTLSKFSENFNSTYGTGLAPFENNILNSIIDSNNTPYGFYSTVSQDMENLIQKRNNQKIKDINRNGGFLSIERCKTKDGDTYLAGENKQCGEKLIECLKNAGNDINKKSECQKEAEECNNPIFTDKDCEYVTPGKIVAEKVSKTLDMEDENLMLADEFDELLSALLTKLTESIFDSDSGGLLGYDAEKDFKENDSLDTIKRDLLIESFCPKKYDLEKKINSATRNLWYEYYKKVVEIRESWDCRAVKNCGKDKDKDYRINYSDNLFPNNECHKTDISSTRSYFGPIDGLLNKISGCTPDSPKNEEGFCKYNENDPNPDPTKSLLSYYDDLNKKIDEQKLKVKTNKIIEKIKKAKTNQDLDRLYNEYKNLIAKPSEAIKRYQETRNEIDNEFNGNGGVGGFIVLKEYLKSFTETNNLEKSKYEENKKNNDNKDKDKNNNEEKKYKCRIQANYSELMTKRSGVRDNFAFNKNFDDDIKKATCLNNNSIFTSNNNYGGGDDQ